MSRGDVVLFKGQLTLVNDRFTPLESMIDDLLFVRTVLESSAFEYLLVRGNDARPVIAVNWEQRSAIQEALALAMVAEPFYSKTVDPTAGPALVVADGRLSADDEARVVRLYRPRVEPLGQLRYGAATGVQLEFWSFGEEEILA
ncbi:MAG: hypothetical protein JWM51_272, partial [Microbacteriaceae bacterium]|nr:hypothetical protein [Microbacteriaceae bacterium]